MKEKGKNGLYVQDWRKRNRDQYNEYQRKYRQKNREKIRERDRKRSKTPERKEYTAKRKKQRYHQDPEYRKKLREHTEKWRLANPDKKKGIQHRYYQRNSVAILERARKKWSDIKTEVYRLLGDKCIRCGFTDIRALQIDHVNGGGLKGKRGTPKSYYMLVRESIKRGEQKYQLLCANCNWIKAYENHEREGS